MHRLSKTLATLGIGFCVACTGYRVRHVEPPLLAALEPAPANLGKVCVFRASLIGGALILPVRDNGEVVGVTDGQGHFCYLATPGRHTLTTDVSDASPLVLEVRTGDIHHVEHEVNIGTDALVPLTEERAGELPPPLPYAVVSEAPEGAPLPAPVATAIGH